MSNPADQPTTVRPRRARPQPEAKPTTESTRRPRRLSAEARRVALSRVPFANTRGLTRWTWLGADLLAGLALLALLTVAFLPTFGNGWIWVTVIGGGVVGMLLGLLGTRFRLNSALLLLAMVVAWFGLGGFLAMPSSTTAAVVPTMRTLRGLATGPVTAPKAMLTLEPPIGETWNLLTVPLLIAMLAGLVATSISLRTRRPTWAWTPWVASILLAWGLGTNVSHRPALTGIALVATVLLWTSHRRRVIRETLVQQRRRIRVLTPVLGALVLALVGLGAWVAAPRVEPTEARAVLRHQVSAPLEVNRYASPLQSMRGVLTMSENEALFNVNGMPKGSVLRIATLDSYDGITYNVSNADAAVPDAGTFRRVGARIATDVEGIETTTEVTVLKYESVWVPTVGQTTRIAFTGDRGLALGDNFYYNKVTGTGVATVGVRSGDSYVLDAVVPSRPDDEVIRAASAGAVEQPEVTGVPDSVRDLALRWTAGSATRGEAALKLEEYFKTKGYFSHGLPKQTKSLSGHSSDRILNLLSNPAQMVGDEEQYAVAMALMARQLGIPARVMFGFRAPESGSGDIQGKNVGAWPELYLDGLGWVTFDPTPPQTRVLPKTKDPTPPRPRPHVVNPPPNPQKPKQPPSDHNLPVDDAQKPPVTPPINWKQIGTYAALIGLPLTTVFGPLILVLGLKGRRRSQRRNHPVVANRVAGAWSELVDKARDLGRSPAPTATRSEQAEAMVVAFPRMIEDADPIALAKRADSVVFSPDVIPEEQAAHYWTTVHEAERGVRKSVGLGRWLRSRLSTKSFRKFG